MKIPESSLKIMANFQKACKSGNTSEVDKSPLQDIKMAKAAVDKLTQSTLAKAFRGELVPQDPNDEPASVLLERIRSSKNSNEKRKKRARNI